MIIGNQARLDDATEATIEYSNNEINIEADGYIGGIDIIVEFADESRTRVGRVDDQTAMVALFDVDMESLAYAINDPDSPSVDPLITEHVVRHDVYSLTTIVSPA